MIKISDSEWKIMNLLWEKTPKTMMEITKELYPETGWTKHTVMTLLKRMESKDLIRHEEGKRAKQYYYNIDRKEAVIEEKNNFLNKVFRGNAGLMINMMLEQGDLNNEEIKELLKNLERMKGKQ